MKIWLDDIRPAPKGYKWCKGVRHAQIAIEKLEEDIAGAIASINSYQEHYDSLYPNDKEYYEKFLRPTMEKRIKDSTIEVIDIDHDAGDYVQFGGDYIKLLDWLEETGRNYPIHIHSMNPVGVENMRRIIKRNGWKEV